MSINHTFPDFQSKKSRNSPQYPQPSSIQYGPTMDTPLNIGMANGLSCLGSLESSDLQANQPMLPPYYPHSSSHRTPSPADSNVLQFPESVVQTPLLPLPLGNSSCMAPPAVTTPQSMVSSDSAQPSRIGPSRTTKKKSCVTRNKTPCGRCSSQKRKVSSIFLLHNAVSLPAVLYSVSVSLKTCASAAKMQTWTNVLLPSRGVSAGTILTKSN